jgi:hypothetical protein
MNISLLRNSALVHTRTNCASPRKRGFPLLMRKFVSSFGGFSVKAFTNRDFVGVRIWLTPPLPVPPYRHPARQSAVHHRARAAAMPWPHPTARAHPDVAFFRRRQDHWHCLWVDRFNDRVRSRGQEAIDQMRAGDRLRLGATVAFELGPEATKGEQRSNVLLFGLRVRLRRIFSRQRLSGLSQACQWGEVALRICGIFYERPARAWRRRLRYGLRPRCLRLCCGLWRREH